MPLLLPEWVQAQEINRALAEQADHEIEAARYWNHELKRIDPTLSLVWVPEQADEAELTPACWHICKRIPGSVDAYIHLLGPNGEFLPPGGWMLDWLTANDLWNPRVHRDKQEAKEKVRQAKNRQRKLEAEQRKDHMAEAYRAASRLRGDAGMHTRTDRKRKGEGIKKAEK